jgi:hypothetical protein
VLLVERTAHLSLVAHGQSVNVIPHHATQRLARFL